jgi:3-phosphoglycerate kinase
LTTSTPIIAPRRSVRNLPVNGKRVLVRVDYNVPMEAGRVTDDNRVQASLPTIQYLIKTGARIVLISHLGRPKGKKDPSQSLQPVAAVLGKLLKKEIQFFPDCVGAEAVQATKNLKAGDVLLLENLRFYAQEEKNDPAFAAQLAQLGDVFVQDAFGAVHRAHASTEALAKLLPSAAGFLLEKELTYLSKIRQNPDKPYVAILGGAKVSDKIAVLEALVELVDGLVIGGAMAYTFLASLGQELGNSRVEKDHISTAKTILDKARSKNIRVILPIDHRTVTAIDQPSTLQISANIPTGRLGVDIGPATGAEIEKFLSKAKTVFWNGPMGIFEKPEYAQGTNQVAKILAQITEKGATTVVGGGDSAAAIKLLGLEPKVSHVSTGGGASLEFVEGRDLPGVSVLPEA